MAPTRPKADRRIVHCLLCHQPQDRLSSHLARSCMRTHTPAERDTEMKRAKESARSFILQGRNWDYNVIYRRLMNKKASVALYRELVGRGFFVSNPPSDDHILDDEQPSTSATTQVSTPPAPAPVADSEDGSTSPSEEASTSSSEEAASAADPAWQKPQARHMTTVRVNMSKMGLYNKFANETKLLVDFKQHLLHALNVPNCQQEVDNVSRMLRFIQPVGDEISLDFLTKSTETKEFLYQLKKAKMEPATVLNYIKNMIRFVSYLRTHLNFASKDKDYDRKCNAYIDLLSTLRKPVAKQYSSRAVDKRYCIYVTGQRSLRECQKVLRVAHKDMLCTFGKLMETPPPQLSSEEKTVYRSYCEGIILLKHYQRPGVVNNMQVREWLERRLINGNFSIGVREHKTATQQVATFCLNTEENAMLEAYYLHLRPDLVTDDTEDNGRFFINARGKPVKSTQDLDRLHKHYSLPSVTSQEVRRVVETIASQAMTEEQKKQVATYMAHSTAVRMKTPEFAVATINLLRSFEGSSEDSGDDRSATGEKRSREDDPAASFSNFIERFPVGLTGQPPTKKQRVEAGFSEDRVFYDRWRAEQYGRRQEHLLSQFTRRPPTAHKVQRAIEKEGWTGNCPSPGDVVSKWRPAVKLAVENDPKIIRMVTRQKWSGLAIKDFGGNKGQGVVATRTFAKGSIVCDYHGKVITRAEGRELQTSIQESMCYLFFFKAGGQQLCIDAQTFPCECHPDMDTFGRKMNHSRKNPNLKPLHCLMQLRDGQKDIILFKAVRDISVDEELKFDYGVNRHFNHGEGLELDWLDE